MNEQPEEINNLREIYRKYALVYDQIFRYVQAHVAVLNETVEACKDRPSIADICTGTGLFPERYIGTQTTIVGIDVVEEMITLAKNKMDSYKNISFLINDARNLAIPDNTMDASIMINGLYNMTEPINAVREMMRITKEGGLIILAGPKPRHDFGVVLQGINHDLYRANMKPALEEAFNVLIECNVLLAKNAQENTYRAKELAKILLEEGCSNILRAHENSYYGQAHYVIAKK